VIMARSSVRRIFVFVLAVLVTVGLNLSAVQAAAAMPEMAKMSMMAGMDKSGDHGCKQCGGDMGGGKAMVCSPVCVGSLATNPQPVFQPVVRAAVRFGDLLRLLAGRSLAPEPYPPRPFHFI
jgi:hypothetical protein